MEKSRTLLTFSDYERRVSNFGGKVLAGYQNCIQSGLTKIWRTINFSEKFQSSYPFRSLRVNFSNLAKKTSASFSKHSSTRPEVRFDDFFVQNLYFPFLFLILSSQFSEFRETFLVRITKLHFTV